VGMNDRVLITDIKASLEKGSELTLKCPARDKTFALRYTLSSRQRDILLAGGMLNYTRMKSK